MKRYSILIFSLLIILLLQACKDKDEEETRPKVQILSPPAFSIYNVGETIRVKASIYHDKPVKSVEVSLVNDNNIPMSTPVGLVPNQPTFEFEVNLVIDNLGLASGSYFVMVKASDEINSTRSFQPVAVTGIETELRRILVITRLNALKSNISLIDSVYNVTQILGISKEYVGSAVNSKNQQLYYITPDPSLLMTFDLKDTILDWEYSAQSPYPIFEDVYFEDDMVYLASQNGNIMGLNHLGENKFGTVVHNDRVPQKIYKHNNLVICDQRTRSNFYRYFTLFFSATGAFANQHRTDLEVVEFFSRNDQEIIAFGNEAEQARVLIYTIDENNSSEPAIMPTGKVINAVQINENEVLLAMDYGILLYNIINFQHFLAFDLAHVSAMDYDPLNQFLCISVGNEVMIYNYPGSGLLHTVTMDYPVLNLHLLYNK